MYITRRDKICGFITQQSLAIKYVQIITNARIKFKIHHAELLIGSLF